MRPGELAPADLLPFVLLGLGLTAPVAALDHGFDEIQTETRSDTTVARVAERTGRRGGSGRNGRAQVRESPQEAGRGMDRPKLLRTVQYQRQVVRNSHTNARDGR